MTKPVKMLVEFEGLEYDPRLKHRVFEGGISWRVLPDGIYQGDLDTPMRTYGEPKTLRKIKNTHGHILESTDCYDSKFIATLIATESGSDSQASRFEPTLDDWSFGPCQLLTNTALGLSKKSPHLPTPPSKLDLGSMQSMSEWRAFLCEPTNAILYATAYVVNCWNGCIDPIVLYAMYNAGGAYYSNKNRWGLRSAPGALDRFAAWYGDACEVFK